MSIHTAPEDNLDALAGARVHSLLWQRHKTNRDLSRQLGVQDSAISKKLRGIRGWSLEEIRVTAAYLDTTVAYLVGESDDPGRPIRP